MTTRSVAGVGDAGALPVAAAPSIRERCCDGRTTLSPMPWSARAEVLEALGDREKAAGAYQRFLELWAEADPALQPQLRMAREGLARVRGAMRPATG